ncbi:hypothetical protein M9Y10_042569 [Tritrichomonas musculus]|uniref:RRM domain-containing protein n=1 Tax=Tritrichomonas musculus TaxID=1915356 RepID=A0ABR2GN60_9EUKA
MSSKQDSADRPLNFPPCREYTKTDLEFNEFSPRNNHFYFFVSEKTEPNYYLINRECTTIFGVKYASDIQQYCYYPGTKKIYTFLGFKTKEERTRAMKNKKILNSVIDQTVTIYPIQENPEKKKPKANAQPDQTKNIDYSKMPEPTKCPQDELEFPTFIPQSNCIYVFFAERDTPTQNTLKSKYNSIFGIGYSLDIQRFRFYPGTKGVYTFIGFVNQNVATKAIKTLHKIALNRSVFFYPFKPPTQEETVAKEKENLNIDTNIDAKTQKEKAKNENQTVQSQSQKVQSQSQKVQNQNENQKVKNQSQKVQSQNENTKVQSQSQNENQKVHSQSNKVSDNKNSDLNKNDNKVTIIPSPYIKADSAGGGSCEPFFEMKSGIYYLCFKETRTEIRNVRKENTKLFGIGNIIDLQRGVKFADKREAGYYTFMGFEKVKELNRALSILMKQKSLIDITSFQEINDFENDYDDDYDDDDDNDDVVDDEFEDDDDDDVDDNGKDDDN